MPAAPIRGYAQGAYRIILKQRSEAYKRLSEAQATVSYIENKVRHYEDILSGALPDDTNPQKWTESTKPQTHFI